MMFHHEIIAPMTKLCEKMTGVEFPLREDINNLSVLLQECHTLLKGEASNAEISKDVCVINLTEGNASLIKVVENLTQEINHKTGMLDEQVKLVGTLSAQLSAKNAECTTISQGRLDAEQQQGVREERIEELKLEIKELKTKIKTMEDDAVEAQAADAKDDAEDDAVKALDDAEDDAVVAKDDAVKAQNDAVDNDDWKVDGLAGSANSTEFEKL